MATLPGSGLDTEDTRIHRLWIYETAGRYFIVGGDIDEARFRILKIDRTASFGSLSIIEDDHVYGREEKEALLSAIDDGNKSTGGMKLRCPTCWGILGFIRFTEAYYMLVVTKKQSVAMIGGRYIYQVDGTELLPLTTGSSSRFAANRNAEETRFLTIFNNLDLHRSFYFSYSYNITRTLQHNIIRHRKTLDGHLSPSTTSDYNDMFVWNQHLLEPALETLRNPYDWCVPIIHGFIDQASVNVFGQSIYITLIARRSRFFAGARFLKRGANDLGYVANDVETEQIVADMSVTSFNTSKHHPFNNPNYTSFVQHRGSIPLYWTQDNSGVSPKPDIDINFKDPFYATAALHFDNLFQRYKAPVCVLNLVKAKERTRREGKLLEEYQNAINYLNQMLPEGKKIVYRAYDMARAVKTRGQDVIGTLEEIASELVDTTGFFHNGLSQSTDNEITTSVQNGVIRSNCIDCLDRTNAAQFVVGKRALTCQLQALGILPDASLNYDCDATNLFAHMFNDHGDTLASQYGGSHLVNTTDSYRKINNWQSHSRDMLESFKRYYHNSFLDNQRQEAYNLFLGNYIYAQGQPMLWELPNDFYLHHTHPTAGSTNPRRHYIKWYTPQNLEPDFLPPIPHPEKQPGIFEIRDWWDEYYRPTIISSFLRIFAYKINSTTRYLPKVLPRRYDMSPFAVRKANSTADADRPSTSSSSFFTTEKKDVDKEASKHPLNPINMTSPPQARTSRITSLQNWLHPHSNSPKFDHDPRTNQTHQVHQSEQASAQSTQLPHQRTHDKTQIHNWTLNAFISSSLNPSVSTKERDEYADYVSHPLRLLSETHRDSDPRARRLVQEAEQYVDRGRAEQLLLDDGLQPSDYDRFDIMTTVQGPKAHHSKISSHDVTKDATVHKETLPMKSSTNSLEVSDSAEKEYVLWLSEAYRPDILKVNDEDREKKRYQAYGKWLRGKSLFKQSKVDPEFREA